MDVNVETAKFALFRICNTDIKWVNEFNAQFGAKQHQKTNWFATHKRQIHWIASIKRQTAVNLAALAPYYYCI